jgi:hypothetical protein
MCTGPQGATSLKLPLTSVCWDCNDDCSHGRVELLTFYAKLGSPKGGKITTQINLQENAYYVLSYDLLPSGTNTLNIVYAPGAWTTRIDVVNASNGQPTENILNKVQFDQQDVYGSSMRRTLSFFLPVGRAAILVTFSALLVCSPSEGPYLEVFMSVSHPHKPKTVY